jgi:RNA-directed DNA polymerase
VLGPCPGKHLVKQWLKAGYLEQGVVHATPLGAPQGAVLSPLLLNVALHGLEAALGVKYDSQGCVRSSRAVVRYADDGLVFCESQAEAHRVLDTLKPWLAERGLTLAPEKTQIVHLREGFEFLGCQVRHYRVRHSRWGYKLLITPSKESVQRVRQKLCDEWRRRRGATVAVVVQGLNRLIRGWANYFRPVVASATFRTLDDWMFTRAVRYVKAKHPTKLWQWQRNRYWGPWNPQRHDHWVCGDKRTGVFLLKFSWFSIRRHVLVRGTASPDDPALRAYWQARERAKSWALPPRKRAVARAQGYLCEQCGESLFNGEPLHTHHVVPKARGGRDDPSNLKLLHLYCHQQVHRRAHAHESLEVVEVE